MQTTLKHIDVGSAFRLGIVLCGLLFAVFGLLFVLLQGLLLSAITASVDFNSPIAPNNAAAFLGSGILGLLCFYGVGIVVGAIFGGIQFALLAFFYNLAAGWVGGVRFELESSDAGLLDDIERDLGKRKRDEL